MIEFTLALSFVAFILYWTTRNFFVQMTAFKLSMDAMFLFLLYCNSQQNWLLNLAWILMMLGMAIIFLNLIVSIRSLAKKESVELTENLK